MKDGFDVRGFFYWTLIDNFEWNFAWVRRTCNEAIIMRGSSPQASADLCNSVQLCALLYMSSVETSSLQIIGRNIIVVNLAGAEVWPV